MQNNSKCSKFLILFVWRFLKQLFGFHESLHKGRECKIYSTAPQQKFTCSKLTIQTQESGVKYVQS